MKTDQRSLLGLKVRDRVTGFSGITTSVTFDLYGCIQAFVTPPQGKDGKLPDGGWFDSHRLETTSSTPVMEVPVFAPETPKGGQSLPSPHRS